MPKPIVRRRRKTRLVLPARLSLGVVSQHQDRGLTKRARLFDRLPATATSHVAGVVGARYPLATFGAKRWAWVATAQPRSQPLFLEGHALEVTALELLASAFRCPLIEAGEAGSVKHLVTNLHAFGERIGSSKRGAGLELRFA